MKFKILSLLSAIMLTSCSTLDIQAADPNPTPHDVTEGAGVFSEDGNLIKNFKGFGSSSSGVAMQVNPYLWKSSLEAISFMPLIQADSMGGVIISDWINQENDDNKQVKVNIYILSKKLEASALEVKVFEKTKNADGSFSSQMLDKATSDALEDTILSNARSLKIKALAQ
jgi:hypothetical protein